MAYFYAAFVQQSPDGQLPRMFHVWPHLDNADKESLKAELDASFESFDPDDYQARLPQWMRCNAGAGYVGIISDQDATYVEIVAWDTRREIQISLR